MTDMILRARIAHSREIDSIPFRFEGENRALAALLVSLYAVRFDREPSRRPSQIGSDQLCTTLTFRRTVQGTPETPKKGYGGFLPMVADFDEILLAGSGTRVGSPRQVSAPETAISVFYSEVKS